jgi:cellulose synthase/poly-beta-1,6-N-acetylglucosamine synthase-like glycosyltransferase
MSLAIILAPRAAPPMPAPSQLDGVIRIAYAATLALLFVYGVHRIWLLFRFRWDRRVPPSRTEGVGQAEMPRVTVQLPIYNERTVASRLIRAAGAMEYPAGRLEIQVLDDSTDETVAIVDEEVRCLVERGIDARVLRRPDRVGFKAGALHYGLRSAKGELICIFDADFVPDSDFLQRLVSRFDDPRVGMVQARWGHRNREDSMLTRAESTLLDGHFVIEHKVRHDAGVFFNFNGTAGIWRRAAIDTAGGWEHDTLTEDLDLSYRAQLEGWKFVYVPMVVAPAEVPPDIAAFKSQQHRWAKGSVQVFRKLGWRILTSRQPLSVKLEAMAHLTGNVGYPCVLLLSILLPLSLSLRHEFSQWVVVALFVACTLSVLAFYETSQRVLDRKLAPRFFDTIGAVSLGIGMCVSQTRAVVEGLLPGTGVFVRTPKKGDAPRGKRYASALKGMPGIELAFAAWYVWGIIEAAKHQMWGSLPFLALFFASFAWVGWLSLRDRLRPMLARETESVTVEVTA